MTTIGKVGSAFLAGIICSFSLSAAETFKEKFGGKLDTDWKWIRENPRTWRAVGDRLEIRIEPGNMWGPANDGKNVLVRSVPDPAEQQVELRARVANVPSEQWEQVDLVWYYDDSHMVKIGLEQVDGKVTIVMGREEKDRARTITIIPTDLRDVELRLTASGNQIVGEFKKPGAEKWERAGECDLPGKGKANMSIQTYNGHPEKEHWAQIKHLSVEVKPR